MSTWALVLGGVVHEITDVDPTDRFPPDMTWVPCAGATAQGWTFDGTEFSPPAADPAAAALALQVTAKTALDASDLTLLRCVENGVAVPAEWRTYRAELRVILGAGTGTLPARPAYPAGT